MTSMTSKGKRSANSKVNQKNKTINGAGVSYPTNFKRAGGGASGPAKSKD